MDLDNWEMEPLGGRGGLGSREVKEEGDHTEGSENTKTGCCSRSHKTAPDGLDWDELASEFRNLFKFNAENRSRGAIVKTFLIIFTTSLAPSFWDTGSDALSTYNFINGTTYTKYVPDLNHSSVNSSQCTHVGTLLQKNGNISEVVYEEVECFEQDPVWGYVSLAFLILPGLDGGRVWAGLNCCLGLTILTLPFFPFCLLAVKTIGLLNPGNNWKILAGRYAASEGFWESRYQLLLQLFIVFTRADRAPSLTQMCTLASSVVMLAKCSLDNLRRNQRTVEIKAADFLPGILARLVFFFGHLALLAAFLRNGTIVLLFIVGNFFVGPPLVVLFCLLYLVSSKFRETLKKAKQVMTTKDTILVGPIELDKREVIKDLAIRVISSLYFPLLTGLTIAANIDPSLKMPGQKVEVCVSISLKSELFLAPTRALYITMRQK